MADDDRKFHWQEGNKFALETAKSLFFLGNASVAALLAYFAKAGTGDWRIWTAVTLFLIGSISAILIMLFGYMANLRYGNASEHGGIDSTIWNAAGRWHIASYVVGIISVAAIAVAVGITCWYFLWPQSAVAPAAA